MSKASVPNTPLFVSLHSRYDSRFRKTSVKRTRRTMIYFWPPNIFLIAVPVVGIMDNKETSPWPLWGEDCLLTLSIDGEASHFICFARLSHHFLSLGKAHPSTSSSNLQGIFMFIHSIFLNNTFARGPFLNLSSLQWRCKITHLNRTWQAGRTQILASYLLVYDFNTFIILSLLSML